MTLKESFLMFCAAVLFAGELALCSPDQEEVAMGVQSNDASTHKSLSSSDILAVPKAIDSTTTKTTSTAGNAQFENMLAAVSKFELEAQAFPHPGVERLGHSAVLVDLNAIVVIWQHGSIKASLPT
ncbi:hypothetical protein ACA910_017867 [Epithemia clementina (nom. ined.)]